MTNNLVLTTNNLLIFAFMQKIIFLLIIAISILNSCKNESSKTEANSTPKELTTHLKSDSLKIEFDFPMAWKSIKTQGQKNLITLKQPLTEPADSYQENVLIWTEQLPMNISDSLYQLTVIAELKITNPNLVVKNDGKIQIGDKKFYQYSFEFTPSDSNHYVVNGYTYFNTKDSMAYNFNATSELKNNSKFKSDIEELISTFKTR